MSLRFRLAFCAFPLLVSSIGACAGGADEGSSVTDSGGPIGDSGVDSSPADVGSDVSDTATTADVVDASDAADVVEADAPLPWPTCDARPDAASPTTIPDVWTANPSAPVYDWISGVVVTGVSQGACGAGKACQIFVEDATAFADLTAAAHRAIKLFVSATAASHFVGIAVGDRVDVAGWGWRYTIAGQNELLLEVNDLLRGCAKKTGTGTVTPVAATLTQLGSVDAYETTYGPVLVQLTSITGKTGATPTETFGLWATGTSDAGGASIVSASPFFLPGGAFTGLIPSTITDFTSITGVFGLFYPSGGADAGPATKYLEIYPRTAGDLVGK